jgi:hypothetical protein
VLVLGGAAVVAYIAGVWGFPIRGPNGILGPLDANLALIYTRFANEDYSAYGPLGIVALLAAAAVTVYAWFRGRADARHLVLASSFPVFLVLISLYSTWHPFLIRFFLLPAVLTAPLLACLLRNRLVVAAYASVAILTIALTITQDEPKPLDNPFNYGPPWHLTQETALITNSDQPWAYMYAAYERLIPPRACVGALVGDSEPSYLLYGPHLQHRVVYLPTVAPVDAAYLGGLYYTVVSTMYYAWAVPLFESAGWTIHPLGGSSWVLARAPRAGGGICPA